MNPFRTSVPTGNSDQEFGLVPEGGPPKGRIESPRTLSKAMKALAGQLPKIWGKGLDPSDPSNRDPEFIEKVVLPFFRLLYKYYFRVEAEGLEKIPSDKPFLVVSNHNGGPILPDTWMMLTYWWSIYGARRPGYAVVHDFVFRVPIVKTFIGKVGGVSANRANAGKVLERGGPLVVYPGGTEDCFKSYWKRHKICFENRTGFVRLALEERVPILPVVSVGGARGLLHSVFEQKACSMDRPNQVGQDQILSGEPRPALGNLDDRLPSLHPLALETEIQGWKPHSPRTAALACDSRWIH